MRAWESGGRGKEKVGGTERENARNCVYPPRERVGWVKLALKRADCDCSVPD